jgi:hypothetical protein
MATGFPTKANWVSGDILTAAQMDDLAGTVNLLNPTAKGGLVSASAANTPGVLAVGADGTTLVANSSASTGLSWAGPLIAAGKNAIINGGMDIWQRGTSSGSAGYQTADRWYENATSSTTFAQEATTVPAGSKYCFKMTAGATASMNISQAIETLNSLQFANQTVIASAQVQASVSTGMTIQLYYSTSVDNPASGSWTTVGAPISGGTATAVSGSFTKMTGTFSVPSTAKSLFLQVTTTSTVANGVIVYVGQVQLELGSVATTFSRAGGTIQGELANCQRYYQRINASSSNSLSAFGQGIAATTTTCQIPFSPVVTPRVPPTVSFNSATGFRLNDLSTAPSTTTAMAPVAAAYMDDGKFTVLATVASGLTQFRMYQLSPVNASNAYIEISAEL